MAEGDGSLGGIYFMPRSWVDRLDLWMAMARDAFAEGNRRVVDEVVDSEGSGLKVVVNIGAHALVSFVDQGRYRNLYERPVVGADAPRTVTDPRCLVDTAVGIGADTYFGAVALGGAGIRYYGEYCMVLVLDQVDPDPQLFDRDSYDVLEPPLHGHPQQADLIERLKGVWAGDRRAMVLMKVLPELAHGNRLVTSGTISEVVLKDQEFIEVHLRPPRPAGQVGGFGPEDVGEVRQSPDEVAVALRLRERESDGQPLTDVEHEWLVRREAAERAIRAAPWPTRVVTLHGKGYQWA